MVNDIIRRPWRGGGGRLSVTEDVLSAMVDLRSFLWIVSMRNETVHGVFHKSTKILKELYYYFLDHQEYFLKLIEKRISV